MSDPETEAAAEVGRGRRLLNKTPDLAWEVYGLDFGLSWEVPQLAWVVYEVELGGTPFSTKLSICTLDGRMVLFGHGLLTGTIRQD